MRGFNSKAKSNELHQQVHVKSRRGSGNDFHSEFFPDIANELNNAVQRTARCSARIGQRIADFAKDSQEGGIRSFGAIFSGELVNSIEVIVLSYSATDSSFRIGTSITEDYPHYLIRGRKALVGHPVLAFPYFHGGGVHFHSHVREAKPRDYMHNADLLTQAKIPEIVEEELASVFE